MHLKQLEVSFQYLQVKISKKLIKRRKHLCCKSNVGGIKPASSPLTKSPVIERKEASSDQYTVSPSPSSEEGSRPTSPIHDGPGPGGGPDAFCWPTQSNYEENRQLLGTEEESSDRQSSEDEVG